MPQSATVKIIKIEESLAKLDAIFDLEGQSFQHVFEDILSKENKLDLKSTPYGKDSFWYSIWQRSQEDDTRSE